MKISIIAVFLFLKIALASANAQTGLKVETQFKFHERENIVSSQSTFILDANNKAWTTFTEPKNGVALLGRVKKADKTSVHFEYIIVDTKQFNAVISTPEIIARMGEKTEIEIGSISGNEKINISLLAKPAQYSGKK